jgi:hypothetical protein
VAHEKPESELRRLRTEQSKTRRDEVFGGLSHAERAEYNARAERIHKLENEIQATAVAKKSSPPAEANQRRQPREEAETDAPQAEARQPYRSREKDSAQDSRDSIKKRGNVKNESDEKGSE